MPALKLSKAGHVYAAFKSKPNIKEFGFPSHLVVRSGDWPIRFFLTGQMGPTRDQANTGMCTGEGSTGMGMRLYRKWKGLSPIFAPEFTYALERMREGTFSQGDVGAEVITSLEVADPAMNDGNCIGWCPTDVPGYKPLDISSAPTSEQLAAAKLWPGGAFHNIGNVIADIKSCILSDYSLVIGVSVYASFEGEPNLASGLIPYPNVNTEELLGGHEVHAGIGFDDTIQCPNSPNPGAVLIQNSWGVSWGIKCPSPTLSPEGGFAWISYDYLANSNLTSDVRMGHLGKPW